MGCEPNFNPCTDDPNAGTGGTLTGQNKVSGDVRAFQAVGVLLHASTIKGDVSLRGGGGAESCNPPFPGAFADIGSPPFSDAEDNTIGGDLTMTGLHSCWLGPLRNSVRGNVFVAGNSMADPDAMEILATAFTAASPASATARRFNTATPRVPRIRSSGTRSASAVSTYGSRTRSSTDR